MSAASISCKINVPDQLIEQININEIKIIMNGATERARELFQLLCPCLEEQPKQPTCQQCETLHKAVYGSRSARGRLSHKLKEGEDLCHIYQQAMMAPGRLITRHGEVDEEEKVSRSRLAEFILENMASSESEDGAARKPPQKPKKTKVCKTRSFVSKETKKQK